MSYWGTPLLSRLICAVPVGWLTRVTARRVGADCAYEYAVQTALAGMKDKITRRSANLFALWQAIP